MTGQLSLIFLLVVQWILVIGILGIMAHSIRVDKPELNKIVANLVLLRAYMPLFDIEERRYSNSEIFNSIFLVSLLNGIGNQQVLNNLIFDRKIAIPQSIVTMIVLCFGSCRILNRKDVPFF